MENIYDKTYLNLTLFEIRKVLDDLLTWSVENRDYHLDEIYELKKHFDEVEKGL